MFSKKDHKIRGTLSFRLTVWYAIIFTLTSLAALTIFYYHIAAATMANTDDELKEEHHEFTLFMASGGVEEVRYQIEFEAEEEGDSIFFRLLSADGRVQKALNMEAFGQIGVSREALAALQSGSDHAVETVTIPGRVHDIRTIYGALSPDLVFNMGVSLEDNYEYLSVFRKLILWLMLPLFILATLIGWLLARHALKGVQEVTRTASEISKGSIDKRVKVKKRSHEIDQLANTFNEMLDRIQELIKSIREMNDNIAHDLRSPLTRIRGIAEMTLVSKTSEADYQEMAINTIEECDKLIEIINTMLYITETEAGINQFDNHQIDIVELISSACELFDPLAGEKNVQIVTQLPERLYILGDKNKLQRLITNLLENAIKYNRRGGTVTITARQENQHIRIRIDDTGVGIPEQDMPKIFDRFFRCDANRFEPGIGLGLSLAKAIAKTLGGDITVKSRLNQGSSFSVSLPT